MKPFIPLALVAAAVGVSACGSSDDSSSSGSSGGSGGYGAAKSTPAPAAGQKLELEADGDGGLYFEQRKLKAKSGAVTLVMENPSGSGKPHGIAIEGNGVDKDGQIVQPGSKSTITVTLKPGTYEYYCPVPAHKAAGMKGKLTVS
jgi:plastocyanin